MINEQIKKIFTENIHRNIGKNKPIAKEDIIHFAQGYGIEVKSKEAISTILEKIEDSNLMNELCEAFNEFLYIPSWSVAEYFGIETNELNRLLENNLIVADTKVGSFYDKKDKRTVEYDLYNLDILFKYETEQLKEIYNKAFNHSKYNIRLETTNTDDVQLIINELQKIFIVGHSKSYEHRNKEGYYSYFNIELMNSTEQEANALLTKINTLETKIKDLTTENSQLKKSVNMEMYENMKLQNEVNSLHKKLCSGGRKHKFNNDQVNDILKARKEGKSIRALAKEFNCSVGLIHKIVNEHNK